MDLLGSMETQEMTHIGPLGVPYYNNIGPLGLLGV